MPCILTRWINEHWVEQPSKLHRLVCSMVTLQQTSAGWIFAKIRWLSPGVGCRHPDTVGKVSLMRKSMRQVWALHTKQEHSTLLLNGLGLRWLFATLLLQHLIPSQQVASRVWGVCQLLAKWLEVSAILERPLQRYSKVFGLVWANEQSFTLETDFQLTFILYFPCCWDGYGLFVCLQGHSSKPLHNSICLLNLVQNSNIFQNIWILLKLVVVPTHCHLSRVVLCHHNK